MPVLQGFHHVKLPVRDVGRSRDFYVDVLGLAIDIEFREEGALVGVALRDGARSMCLALRHDPDRASALEGFDPVAIGVPTASDLQAWRHHLDALGQSHGGIVQGHQGSVLVGLHDPDGIEIRMYTL